jgi:predicted alpha/beta-fold hydrolase
MSTIVPTILKTFLSTKLAAIGSSFGASFILAYCIPVIASHPSAVRLSILQSIHISCPQLDLSTCSMNSTLLKRGTDLSSFNSLFKFSSHVIDIIGAAISNF